MREEVILRIDDKTQWRFTTSENFIVCTKWYRYEPINTDSPMYNEWLPEDRSITIPKKQAEEFTDIILKLRL